MLSLKYSKYEKGFTLVELMISMLLATILSLVVLNVWSSQVKLSHSEISRNSLESDTHILYDLLSKMLRQASLSSFVVSTSNSVDVEGVVDFKSTQINFSYIQGFNIWPNNQSPYLNNAVTLSWSSDVSSSNTRNTIYIDHENMNLTVLAGSAEKNQMQIVDFDLWPLDVSGEKQDAVSDVALGGYLLTIESRSSSLDSDYKNSKYSDINHPFHHYRTYTVSGIIFPRNS